MDNFLKFVSIKLNSLTKASLGLKSIFAEPSPLYKKELTKFNIPDKNYHLVSYEKFRKSPQSFIDKYKPELLIADEYHRTRTPGSLTGDVMRDVRPKVNRFLGLSGSISNNHDRNQRSSRGNRINQY